MDPLVKFAHGLKSQNHVSRWVLVLEISNLMHLIGNIQYIVKILLILTILILIL